MPIVLAWGSVTAVQERHDELVRIEVDGRPAIVLSRIVGPVEIGDSVVVNTQARELGLGSGEGDVVLVNLTRGLRLRGAEGAHVMALPYTPAQHAVRFAEEDTATADRLDGLPVVCCGLHSQLAPVACALRGRRVAYVQLQGGALPVSLSDTVRALRQRDLLEVAIAAAPCLDGDLQCASVASALLVARARGAEVVVCALGPGVVGTATPFGHGALAVAEAVNVTAALGGRPIVAPRVSFGDERERHRGVSHHTLESLRLCLGNVRVAWPEGLDVPEGLQVAAVDARGWREACEGLALSHMGRGREDDPWFFETAFAAGVLAAGLLA